MLIDVSVRSISVSANLEDLELYLALDAVAVIVVSWGSSDVI